MRVFYEVAPLYEYTYNGRTWRWEYRPIGPPYWPIRSDGEPYARMPPNNSEFWKALKAWDQEEDKERYRL